MPVFLSYADLTASWTKSGRAVEELPPPSEAVIDLRVLAASALQVRRRVWEKMAVEGGAEVVGEGARG
eukprot:2856475-Prymnesium_polylepis.1